MPGTATDTAKTIFVGTGIPVAAPAAPGGDRNTAREKAFKDRVAAGEILFTPGKTAAYAIQQRIAELDMLISAQVNEVLHDPAFQALEASWTGLHDLVQNTETGEMLKLRMLSATPKELYDDLSGAVDRDQSALFKKLYEEEYGTFGGSAFSVLLFDHEFGRAEGGEGRLTPPQEMELATLLSQVAAAAHAPVIAAAHPSLFDEEWKDFRQLPLPRDLGKIFESIDMAGWRALRESEDSRYLALVLPRVLMRLPYGARTVPVDGMEFDEVRARAGATGSDIALEHEEYLWGTAVWALGRRITEAYSLYGWCVAIRGVEGGGLVEGLPLHTFKTPSGESVGKIPTEVAITDRREKELNDLGFIALCYQKGTEDACFFGGATVQQPKQYTSSAANQNAQASALLPYVLAASHFAHYIKKIGREKVGGFQTRAGLEKTLNDWISGYVLLNDDAPQSAKARYPLREARIDVTESADQVGAYNATVFLRPHFQLEELTASIRLVASIPAAAAA